MDRKEQEIMDRIKDRAEEIKAPDSLSPDHVKEMLEGKKQKKRLLRLRPMLLPGHLEKVLRWEAREMLPEPDCRVVLRATLLLEKRVV